MQEARHMQQAGAIPDRANSVMELHGHLPAKNRGADVHHEHRSFHLLFSGGVRT
jgi:hypothetical protein